jgi:hypothetical protein
MHAEQLPLPLRHISKRNQVRFKDWTVASWIRGITVHDERKVLAAPKHEFRRYYLGKMQEYFDEDRMAGRPYRICYDGCKKEIRTARDLRRYAGRDWCASCFPKLRAKVRTTENKETQRYFDLVESI